MSPWSGGPRRRTGGASAVREEVSHHRCPGLLRLLEGVVDTLLAGERELELLIEATHEVFGLRQAYELVRGISLLVDVERRLEQWIGLAEVRLCRLVARETVRQRAQLAIRLLTHQVLDQFERLGLVL